VLTDAPCCKRYNLTEMDWLRTVLLAARMRNQQFTEPPIPPEPQHGHEEHWEPDQQVTSESQGSGSRPSNATKSTLIVGGNTASFLQCHDTNTSLLVGEGQADPSFWITIKEGSPASFKRRRYDYLTMGARQIVGTRIQIRFHDVGMGVHIFVPPTVRLETISEPLTGKTSAPRSGRRASLQLVAASLVTDGGAPTGFGDVTPAKLNQPVEVSYKRETASATYEVLHADNPAVIHKATINIYVAYIAATAQALPRLGATSITTAFAPDARSQVVETSPRAAFNINACPSALLFPFVTNQRGLDTRVVLTNTSLDPFGTSAEPGTVTLYFFSGDAGAENPRPVVTQTIPAGKQLDFNLSTGGNFGVPPVPGFQGYIIARADFRYSLGFAIIDGPTGQAAASYPAVRISARAGIPDPEA
jgi:hypothetical protein